MWSTRAGRVFGTLGATTALVASQLLAAPVASADADDDPLCYTTPSATAPDYHGPSASTVYDGAFDPSFAIPAGLLAGRYVPQGVASWNNWNGQGEDVLLISAYLDTNGNAKPDGASAIFGVVANGSRQGTGLGRMLIDQGHVGGIGVFKGWLYVGSEKEIRGYRLSTLRGALAGPNRSTVFAHEYLRPSTYTVGFMGTGNGHLWAGEFDDEAATHLNGYVQTSRETGAIDYVDATQAYAPKKTQGVTVTASSVIFSTSYKRGQRGNIWVMPRNQETLTDANSYCFRAPSMNEGITRLNGRLYLGFEGAAYTYNHTDSRPINQIAQLHSASTAAVTALYGSGPAD